MFTKLLELGSAKVTVPCGVDVGCRTSPAIDVSGETFAVKVTVWFAKIGVGGARLTTVGAFATVTAKGVLLPAAKLVSPLYFAVTECAPTFMKVMMHEAIEVPGCIGSPLTRGSGQISVVLSDVSVKVTVPVGIVVLVVKGGVIRTEKVTF